MVDPEVTELFEALARHGDDPQVLEMFVARHRTSAIEAVERGDKSEIVQLILDGKPLNSIEREYAAGVLSGDVKGRPGRPRDWVLARRVAILFWWLHEVDGKKREQVNGELATSLGISRTKVTNLRKYAKESRTIQGELSGMRLMLKICSAETVHKIRSLDEKS